ncbi:MAG: SgcJ/EcaC family oxidoreductase [Alphaproteobacteria bacterium]|nr:SgcJ/EcaC family oxidoreductase [Alphaproteobacteria bacterium]
MQIRTFSALIAAGALGAMAACSLSEGETPQQPSAATSAPSEEEVAANFGAWEAALATGDPKLVSALFSPNAILAPTVSNQIRDTPAEVEAYFVDFLKMSPRPTINERYIEVLDENTAIDAGVWTFDITRDGEPGWVTARYSFVWEKTDGAWKIQLLHSSAMPEPIAERPAPLAP